MLKKLFIIFILGAIGFLIFVPTAAKQKADELTEAGVNTSQDSSVFGLFYD